MPANSDFNRTSIVRTSPVSLPTAFASASRSATALRLPEPTLGARPLSASLWEVAVPLEIAVAHVHQHGVRDGLAAHHSRGDKVSAKNGEVEYGERNGRVLGASANFIDENRIDVLPGGADPDTVYGGLR